MAQTPLAWHPITDGEKFKVLGLYWFAENQPRCWRLPANRLADLPAGVKARAKESAGGRILLHCDTGGLAIKAQATAKANQLGFDVYLDGKYYRSPSIEEPNVDATVTLFRDLPRKAREIVIYLPTHQDLQLKEIGVDADAHFDAPAHAFAKPLPVVFYGSSICQGQGAARPGMSYEAILCRQRNLDFVNLGFSGAGKAEPAVVDLVSSISACCYVFDLGKSYGLQDAEPFRQMLVTVRKAHPDVPIICLTPITSSLEVNDPVYAKHSEHDRAVMRQATNEFIQSGAARVYLVEGEELFTFADHDGLSRDGLHPSELGYEVIAKRLLPTVDRALGLP
jgi:hypothetical protein